MTSAAYYVFMGSAFDGALSPTPHYYEVQGRAAEIARALGHPVGGAEHLFLGMLHDGTWPVRVIAPLADLDRVKAAVLDIVNGPGYSPPPSPRLLVRPGYVQPWGVEVAREMGDSYLGLEHALLAMIRNRETVPARALAGLADLDALEAAVIAAKNTPLGGPPENAVLLPDNQELDGPLRRAIIDALPGATTFGFNRGADERTWVEVITTDDTGGRALTRQVLNTALAGLHRPTLES